MKYTDFMIGDILLLNGKDVGAKTISNLQKKQSNDNEAFTHAALVVGGNVIIEAKFKIGIRVVAWNEIKDKYDLDKSLRCRLKSFELDSNLAHMITQESHFYYSQPYNVYKVFANSSMTNDQDGMICSQLVELIFNKIDISFKRDKHYVWPVHIYNAVIDNDEWHIKKLSEEIIYECDQSDNILYQEIKNNLEFDQLILGQFERMNRTVDQLNEIEELKEFSYKLLKSAKTESDLENVKKIIGVQSEEIDLTSILSVIEDVIEKFSNRKDVKALMLKQKKVYTNIEVLKELESIFFGLTKKLSLYAELYKKVLEQFVKEKVIVEEISIQIDRLMYIPNPIAISERNDKISSIQIKLENNTFVDNSIKDFIEMFLKIIKTYDDCSVEWNNFKNFASVHKLD